MLNYYDIYLFLIPNIFNVCLKMLHLVTLAFLAAIVRDPSLMEALDHDEMGPALPTPLSNAQPLPNSYPQLVRQPRDHSLIYRKFI